LLLGSLFAVFYANVMSWCSPEQSATDYTMISSVFSLTAVLGGSASGFTAAGLGYHGHFVLAAGMFVLTIWALRALHPRISAGVAIALAVPEAHVSGIPPALDPVR
ncbi:MAG: hypothetical protein OEO23_07865, partial [Gemmatimonadota bacterium]|nr:hypothetical protein [Gemmatimonadota bacterium]